MINNWNDCDNVLREIALIDLAVSRAETAKQRAMLDAETQYSAATAPLLARREEMAAEVESFYRANRKEVEASGKRSKELSFGRIGMRLGNPTLALAKGWKWEKVLAAIKERWSRQPDLLKSLVTVKESVNKEGVKSRLDEAGMAAVGLRLKQEDEFFIETFPEKVRQAA